MLRITGGLFKGQSIQTPNGMTTRPTLSRLREAIFNSIQGRAEGAKVLDLFSGSGALGFEALSRGAEFVFFIDSSTQAKKCIEESAKKLKLKDRSVFIQSTVENSISILQREAPFDLVLADPPYEQKLDEWILKSIDWSEVLAEDGVLIIESRHCQEVLPECIPSLVKIREKKYGDSVLTNYQKINVN